MKKALFCWLFSIATALPITAQSGYMIYSQGGIKQSSYAGLTVLRDTLPTLPFYGLQLGGGFSRHFKGNFYWYAGLHYATLGKRQLITDDLAWPGEYDDNSGYQRDPDLPHRVTQEQHTAYLSLRVGLGYYLKGGEKFRVKLMPLAEANFNWSNTKDKRLYMDDHSTIYSIMGESKLPLRSMNVSAGLALSFEAKIVGQFDLFVSPEITHQLLSTLESPYSDRRRYLAWGLSIGFICRI